MVAGYVQVNLSDMLDEMEESAVKTVLSSFSCAGLNDDVEDFLRNKAIEFSKMGIAATHLVYASYRGEPVLAGYFSLAYKTIEINTKTLSSSVRRRLLRFGKADEKGRISIAMPLIGQLGRNMVHREKRLITGDELLKMACDKVRQIQMVSGGRFVYLECERKPRLLEFYGRNGFVEFGDRKLDGDETGIDGGVLVQMLRYLKEDKQST